jgi:hypothetical protein
MNTNIPKSAMLVLGLVAIIGLFVFIPREQPTEKREAI